MGVLARNGTESPEEIRKIAYRRQLTRSKDIRAAIADVCRELEAVTIKMDSETARTLGYLYNLLGDKIKERDLQKMADRLEKHAERREQLHAVHQ